MMHRDNIVCKDPTFKAPHMTLLIPISEKTASARIEVKGEQRMPFMLSKNL